jgi:hypothetical protein
MENPEGREEEPIYKKPTSLEKPFHYTLLSAKKSYNQMIQSMWTKIYERVNRQINEWTDK